MMTVYEGHNTLNTLFETGSTLNMPYEFGMLLLEVELTN